MLIKKKAKLKANLICSLTNSIMTFLYYSAMDLEDTEVCVIKEPDCVIVYSNGISHDSGHENITNEHNITDAYDHIVEATEHHSSEESTKEYEVKECTTENSVKISDESNIEKGEEQLASSFVGPLCEKNSKSHKTKAVKHGSKHPTGNLHSRCTGNVQRKHTVPQPFALATEKRASGGTRFPLAEDNKGSLERKSINKKNVLTSNIFKQNQVNTDVDSFSLNHYDILIYMKVLKKQDCSRNIYDQGSKSSI